MFGFGENKSRTFLQNGDPVGSINSASLHLRGKSMGYSEKVLDKKKKFLVLLFIFSVAASGGLLFIDVQITIAAKSVNSSVVTIGSGVVDAVKVAWGAAGDAIVAGFKWLLYGVFLFFGLLTSVAIIIFEWAIDPAYISGDPGLFNRQSIYDMWKFIRDFFNLFFILVLLYIAFTVVFQIQKDFKKALLSLVLAALFINFSFPVTRFLIDATNVPMYFFANQMLGKNGKPGLDSALSASKLQGLLVPGGGKEEEFKSGSVTVSRLIAATVFMFIFSITLLVLAIMFLIRLMALLILLVFSSVGFAASIIPGMKEYSDMWWKSFWKYALFGPAAMLMLLIATRFFKEIGDEQGTFIAGFKTVATGVTVPGEMGFIVSMAMFSIPIIMLWFAMGLAQKMSLAGASSVVGAGQKFAKWAGKKTMDGGKWATYNNPVMRGVGLGLKERAEKNKFAKVLTPKFWTEGSKKREERIAGGVGGGRAGYDRVVENQHNKKVEEEEKKMEENRTNRKSLETMRDDRSGKSSKAETEAATRLLSKKDMIQSDSDMRLALDAINYANTDSKGKALSGGAAQTEKRNELIRKAGGEIYKDGNMLAQAIGYLGDDAKAIGALVDKTKKEALNTMAVAAYNGLGTETMKKLEGKMKKEGAIQTLVRDETVSGRSATREAAVVKIMDSTKADDAAKVFKDPTLKSHAETYLSSIRGSNPDRYRKINAEK